MMMREARVSLARFNTKLVPYSLSWVLTSEGLSPGQLISSSPKAMQCRLSVPNLEI